MSISLSGNDLGHGVISEDAIQKSIGNFGKYQLFICFIGFLMKIPLAWHQMAIIFLCPKVSFTCDGVANKCPCSNPEYDREIFSRSIVMEWDLICERKWLTSFAQMIFQFGTLLGSIFFGILSDRYGRRPPFIATVFLQVSCGIAAAYVKSYWLFNLFRLFVGMAVGGAMVVGFVHIMEFVGTKYRPTVSALYQVPFNLGHMSTAVIGYYFRDYSDFQVSISAPVAILIVYICVLPETPRWLIAMQKTEDTIVAIEHVAKINGLPIENVRSDITAYQAYLDTHNLKKGTILDLFKTPNLRKNILAMAFNWLACSYCYYGVSQYISHLTGNIFINVLASAIVTLIGTLCAIPLMKFMRRKTMLILFQAICSACLFLLAFLPEGIISVVCASIGNVSAFIVFILVYLYCSELFPTVVRNAAIGFSSMSARIGSMIAPFVIELRDDAIWIPAVVFAIIPGIAVFVSFLLPETKGCELTTTIEQGEAMGKRPKAVVKK